MNNLTIYKRAYFETIKMLDEARHLQRTSNGGSTVSRYINVLTEELAELIKLIKIEAKKENEDIDE